MGFDNECILNIQYLAGEYFCPVCRLLVYPNEALQSQCTHLYCKPCLTYVVSTTRACPYDGYLVTEADSKPLVESNKTLAETIGKIMVHCLYHRSGCAWQGPLSECTSHCSGCAYGNSPVVCNRCGIQIVHRQVQEHAQNCPSVQPQAQQAEGGQETAASGTTAAADQTQIVSQSGTATSQAQGSQTTTSGTPVQDPNQQANPNPQSQALSQPVVVTSEQWYQQQQQQPQLQQQYQQYYQQYSGYDQYYQQYYPYQQQAVPQYQQQPLQVNASHMVGQHPVYLQTQPQPQPQAQPQSQSSLQAPAAAQPQNQAQINQQQQTHLTMPPHSLILSQTYPIAQGHPQPQVQPFPQVQPHPQVQTIQPHLQHGQMPQYQQHHSQIQQPQPQPQPQLHPAPQAQPHSQAQPQVQLQPQPQPLPHPQPSQPLNPNLMPQHPAANAVTGNQSYPQSQPHQQMQLVIPQNPLHMHAQGGLHPQQHPAEMQNSYPQRPQMRPPQSHVAIPNQQQPGLLPLPGPMLQQVHPPLQPALSVQQRPVMQPPGSPMSQQFLQQQPLSTQPVGLVQPQMHQQGPFAPQQQSLQSQLRPPAPPNSFQQPPHAYPQPQQNFAGSHAVHPHPHPSHNLGGRPMTPSHGVQSQPYPQAAAGVLVKPMQLGSHQPFSYQSNAFRTNSQSVVNSQPISEVPGDHRTDKNVAEREADSSSQAIAKQEGNVGDTSTSKLDADLKSVDEKPTENFGDNSSGFDISTKETSQSRQTTLEPHRDAVSKNMVKVEGIEDQKDVDNGEHNVEGNKIKDGPLLKTPPEQEAKFGEEQNGKMQKDKILPQDEGTLKGPAGNGFRDIPPSSQVQPGGFVQPSRSVPVIDQGRHQPLQMPHGFNDNQQRPAASAMLQAPPAGMPSHAQTVLPPNQFRPQGAGQTSVPPENLGPASFGRGPSNYGPQGPCNQGPPVSGAPRISQCENLVRPPFGAPPLNAFDSHGAPSYGPEGHSVQQSSANMVDYNADNRRLDSRASGHSTSTFSLHGERLKPVRNEHLNPFPLDRAHNVGDRGQFDEDLKQFPRPSHLDTETIPKFGSYFSSRPLDRGPHGFGMDMGPRAHEKESHGLNFDPMIGSGPSRFLPPYHPDDGVERPVGLSEDAIGRPDFLGTVPSYGRHRMDGFVSRSPGREYRGISPHGFGGHPGDEIDSRECRFNDRFSGLPGHLHRGGFDSSDHMMEHLRSRDMIGPDFRPPHFRRGEHLGHHNMPGHLRMEEPIGFGDFSSHERMGEFGGPGNFRHPRLGEPGFRSSFSLREFPNDAGIYAGDRDSFENLRKRKPVSMGWCRICKMDCETVEGLDMHSQTREHQKMAMDMVVTIKQNAKKQKLTSSDHSIRNDSSKSKNAKFEGHVNKH